MPWKTARMSVAAGYCIASLLFGGVLLLPLNSCGGGGGGGGGVDYDYGISLTPDKTIVAPGGIVDLNVHYDAPSSNAGITWKLTCTQTDCGSVSTSGIYTAPAKVDAQMVVGIRATSNDKPSSSYYVEVWVSGKIVVQVTPNNDPMGIHVKETIQFTATVNSPDTGVAWQVNGTTGGNTSVGTISSGGLFTAPEQVPEPDTVTVTAVAHVDSTASTSVRIAIWPPPQVNVSITPRDSTVGTGMTQQFNATVANTTDTAVQWQVNGIEGGNSTVGTISATGLFTAPAIVPSPAKETVTAISHADPSKSDSTSVTIVEVRNGLLNGSYSFELSGPDPNGKMTAAIGSLVADGNGNIHGLMDINSVANAAAQKAVQFTGTYVIGSENVGRMTLSTSLTLSFTINDEGTNAKLIEWDNGGTLFVGSLQKQDTPLSVDKFLGYYVFSCYGSTMSGERTTAIGRFQSTGGGGTILNARVDTKEQGYLLQQLVNLAGTVTMTDNTYGRGEFALAQSGVTLAHFSYYMTDEGDLYFLSTDPVPSDNPLFVGRILKQTGSSFNYGSLSGASVFSLSGINSTDSSKSVVLAGKWRVPPGSTTVSIDYDVNDGGQISTLQSFGTYIDVDITGHGNVTANEFPYRQLYFYMIDANKAVLLQSSGDEGLVGMLEPQTAAAFDNSLFNGNYRIGTASMPVRYSNISQGILIANGQGTFFGGEDILDTIPYSSTFSGNYSVDPTGRTLVTITAPGTVHYVVYPVSGDRFIGIMTDPYSRPNLISMDE